MTTAQFFCSTVDFFIILPKTLKREKKQKLIFPTAAFSSNFSEYPFVYCPCSWWLFIPGAVHEINEWKSVPHRENSGTWTCHHTTVPRNRDYRWVPPISSLREGPDEKLLWIYFLWWRWSVLIMITVIWFCDTTANRVWGWKLRFSVEARVLVRFLFYSDKAVYNLRGMQLLSKIRPNPLPIILLVALNFSHHDAKYHKLSRWMRRASAHSTLSVLSRFACAYCGTILVKTQHFLRQLNAELKRVEKTSTS